VDLPYLLDTLLNGPTRYAQMLHLSALWTLVFALGALLIEAIVVYVIFISLVKMVQNFQSFLGWILRLCLGNRDTSYIFLELTFPADTSKSAFATEQLHILLSGEVNYARFWDKLAGRKLLHSLELVSTRDEGIRYIMRVPKANKEHIERNLRSYLPGLKIKQIDDYLPTPSKVTLGVVELKLSADFVLPLKNQEALKEHDPIAYLTGHMTKLEPDELIAFQVVVAPILKNTHHSVLRRIRIFEHRIALDKELSTQLMSQRHIFWQTIWLLCIPIIWIIKLFGGILSTIFSDTRTSPKSDPDKRRANDPYERELGRIVKTKLDQQLFEVTMRLLATSSDTNAINKRLRALTSSFQPFSSSYQTIRVRRNLLLPSASNKRLLQFQERNLSPHVLSQPTVLSSSELSDLYHFPNTDLTKTEGFVKSRSRDLPAPLSLKHSDAVFDVIVGTNSHGGEDSPIGMTLEQRQKHTYIIGKTGMGKTTLLLSSIYQDMVNGKGLAVFDPHGDMFQELLRIVPEHRQKDVVVFNPSDRDFPIGLNILDPGIEFTDEDDRQDWITSTVLSVFAKLADESYWGPRMEHILRNATMTALQTPNPSLYTLQRLLTDKKYQQSVARTLKDPVLKQFWDKEFKLLGSMQLSSVTAPLTNRLGHFITSKMSRHILLQSKSTVRITDVMNEGKILLINLSKGDVGEDQSFFFGTILTSFIWMAAYQRTKIPEKQRRDFFVYVDEFQNFATPHFSEITSEGRKFHVSLIVSHQNIAQIKDQSILKIVAGNANTIICLKASPADETFILPFMKPEVKKGDIVNLAPYHFYMKVTGEESEEAFSGGTVPLNTDRSAKTKNEVISYSQMMYGTPRVKIEAYMDEIFKNLPTEKRPTASTQDTKRKSQEAKLSRF